jgi:hypothetical protein
MGGEEGDILVEKDLIFLANHSKQGPKIAIFVPKEYHERIKRLHNPLKVTVEEAVLR